MSTVDLAANLEEETFGNSGNSGVSEAQLSTLKIGAQGLSRKPISVPGFDAIELPTGERLAMLNKKYLRTTKPPRTMVERIIDGDASRNAAAAAAAALSAQPHEEDKIVEDEDEHDSQEEEEKTEEDPETDLFGVRKKPAAHKLLKRAGANNSAQGKTDPKTKVTPKPKAKGKPKAESKAKGKPKAEPKAKGKPKTTAKAKAKAKKDAAQEESDDETPQATEPAPASPPNKKLSLADKLKNWRAHGLDSVQNTPTQGAQPASSASSSIWAGAEQEPSDQELSVQQPQTGGKSGAKTKDQLAQYAKKRAFDQQWAGLPDDVRQAYEQCQNKQAKIDFVNERFVKDEKTGDMDVSLLFCLASCLFWLFVHIVCFLVVCVHVHCCCRFYCDICYFIHTPSCSEESIVSIPT